jgi:hypothetical protein
VSEPKFLMPESFIPRKVARPGTTARPAATRSTLVPVLSSGQSSIIGSESHQTGGNNLGKGKADSADHYQAAAASFADKEDCAVLVHLALSEYALWLDSDLLRRLTEHRTEGCKGLILLRPHRRHLTF